MVYTMNKIFHTIGFTILITLLFLMIPNRSNFPKEFMIPILVLLGLLLFFPKNLYIYHRYRIS